MRKLKSTIFLSATFLAYPALAQEAEAPLAEEPAAEDAPAEPEAAPEAAPEPEVEPEAAPKASAAGTVSMGGGGASIVQMGDSSAGADSKRGGPSQSASSTNYGGPVSSSDDEWKFEYHGYFRAPLRIGVGERLEAKEDQSKTTLSQPLVPDDQYLNWQYTKANQRAWAEAFFSFGKKSAKGTLGLQAFNFTDASFKDNTAQFGIAQGWVEWTPDVSALDEDMRMLVKVGSFWARYGGAGRYDAGAYDNFIFGRTHVMGALMRTEYDGEGSTYFFEAGGGAKEPNPDVFHNTKFTLLGHAHVGGSWDELIDVNLHLLHAWTQEPDHECVSREEEWAVQNTEDLQGNPALVQELSARFSEAPIGGCKGEQISGDAGTRTPNDEYVRMDSADGSMTTFGGEVILNSSVGRLWAGVSYLIADHAVTVAPAYEVIHANGGGFFNMGITHQYFIERQNWEDPVANYPVNGGNGNILTAAGQFDSSLSALIGPDALNGQDVSFQVFGMFNKVHSDDDIGMDQYSKLKFGADVVYSPLSWMGAGLRFDRVAPRSDIPEQTFSVIGPRLTFRSDYGTHEEINIGWAHYFYAQMECESYERASSLMCTQPPTATVGPAGWYQRPGVNASKAFRGTPTEPASRTGKYPDTSWDNPHTNTFYINASIWW